MKSSVHKQKLWKECMFGVKSLQTCSYSQAEPKIFIEQRFANILMRIVFWLVFKKAIVYSHQIVLEIQLLKFKSYPFFAVESFHLKYTVNHGNPSWLRSVWGQVCTLASLSSASPGVLSHSSWAADALPDVTYLLNYYPDPTWWALLLTI